VHGDRNDSNDNNNLGILFFFHFISSFFSCEHKRILEWEEEEEEEDGGGSLLAMRDWDELLTEAEEWPHYYCYRREVREKIQQKTDCTHDALLLAF